MSIRGPKEDATLLTLLAALCDETITEAEQEQLGQLLAADRDARRQYIYYMDLHAELADRFEFPATAEEDLRASPKSNFAPKPGPVIFRYAAAAVVLLAVTLSTVVLVQSIWDKDAPVAENPPLPEQVVEEEPIAAIAQLDEVRWGDTDVPLEEGAELRPSTIKFLSGQLRIEFYCGASVLLEGPAEFRLISDSRGHLVHGKMAAIVPEEAIGFVICAPDVAVVDFGTEFSLNVDKSGKSEIRVFDGEVEASLLGDDGASLRSTRLVTGQSIEIDAKQAKMAPVKPRKGQFIRVKPLKFVPLNISPDYVQAVMAAKPLGYWRFEKIVDGVVPNHAGDEFAATVTGPVRTRGKNENEVALFRIADREGGLLLVDDPLVGINSGDYTIEFWVNPHAVKGAVLTGLMTCDPAEDNSRATKQALLVRLCQKSKKLLHPTGAVHVVHRGPGGKGGGTSVFSKKACTPGRWHHVVVVRKQSQLSLYVNGRRVRTVRVNVGADPEPYQLFVGRFPAQPSRKQFFKGELDELAIYPHALGGKEIRKHFTLVRPGTARAADPPEARRSSKP